MANEVYLRHTATGATLYFTIRNTARQMWNTAGTPNFETLTVANWTSYDVALSESPASSYFYVGTFPAISGNMVAGWYFVEVFSQAGGSPAIGDSLIASYFGYWDGTTFKFWADDLQHWKGSTPNDLQSGRIDSYLAAAGLQTDAVEEARNAITGGAYALSTDANGRIRIVDGTGAGELDSLSGTVLLRAATQASIDAIEADSNELQGDWADGGRLDLILDSRASQTSVNDIPTNSEIAQKVADGGILAPSLGPAEAGSQQAKLDTITTQTEDSAIEAAAAAALTAYDAATDADIDSAITSYFGTAGDSLTGLRALITGGAYDLDTDANGRIRVVDGTGAGELDTTSGLVKIAGTLQTLDDLENLSADDVWDEVVDGSYTARQSMRLQNSAMAGKLSGAGTTTITIRDLDDTKNRIVATVDDDGNRSALTLVAT